MPLMRICCGGPPCAGRTHTVSPSVTWLTMAWYFAAWAAMDTQQQAKATRTVRISGEVIERGKAGIHRPAAGIDDTHSVIAVDAADTRGPRAGLRRSLLHRAAGCRRRGEQQVVIGAARQHELQPRFRIDMPGAT